MTYSLIWLPQVLKDAGLNVQAVDGWQARGHGDFGKPMGVLCHHTCGPKDGDIRDLHVLIDGRPDLAGPLCNLGLARSGVFWVVAAGKAWHAGAGNWLGITDGNSHLIGIEAENVGDGTDPWPDVQMNAYKRGCAALLNYIHAPSSMCAGHKEYALPHGRKDDPDFDMVKLSADVASFMANPTVVVPPIAPVAPILHDTKFVQRSLNLLGQKPPLDEDGSYGPKTSGAVKSFQIAYRLEPTGLAGQETIDKMVSLLSPLS